MKTQIVLRCALTLLITFILGQLLLATMQAADCTVPPAGLIGWWQAEGAANDSIGGQTGIVYPGTTYATGVVGAGFSFDGISGCIMNTNSASLTNVQNTFTMEFWVYPQKQINLLDENPGLGGTSGQSYVIFPEWGGFDGDGRAGAGVSVGTNGICVIEHRDGYIPSVLTYATNLNGWTFVSVVYSNKQATLFINGLAVRTGVVSPATFVFPSKNLGNTYGSVWSEYGPFQGLVDEVSLYNRALTTNEIIAIYNAGSAGKCTDGLPALYILTPPASQTVIQGGEIDLSVVAAGGNGSFAYQWTLNGTNISGALNDTLVITNIHPRQAGNYTVKVSNAGGSVTSAPAVITVIAQNVLIYGYAGSEKTISPGKEQTVAFDGKMFFIPATTNAVFVGWATIGGKKQYWVSYASDYRLFTITGALNRTYTLLGKASSSFPDENPGLQHLWFFLHKGQNTRLNIGANKIFSFPSTLAFYNTQVYPANPTALAWREANSTYNYQESSTRTANDNGLTLADLISAAVKSLAKQGYQPQ